MIIRVHHRARYTVLDNIPINDPRLSFQALGLLAYLLSKPDHWAVNYRHLAEVRTGPRGEGQHAVRATLAELEHAGYLVRTRQQDPGGRWTWVSTVYEVPLADTVPSPVDEPCGGNRGIGARGSVPRGSGNRRSSVKTDEQPPEKQAPEHHRPVAAVVPEAIPEGPARATVVPALELAEARAALHGART